jgi:carboxylesterase type B
MRAGRTGTAMTGSRVARLALCSLAAVVSAVGIETSALTQAAPVVVHVESGELQGVVADGVESFKGIPFAAPPVGDLRWRPPQRPAPWTGVRQATEFGADCMQGRFGPPPSAATGAATAPVPSEDCLFLNVWRPAATTARNLPVMVWIYGGGFVGGSSSSPNTSGIGFAKHGVVLVATAESAYKAGRQPRVPFLAGSNSADTAGNRIRAATKDEFFARFGKWSEQAKAAYDPDGSTDLATMVSRANDDFGQAEPARFAANAFAANGSPAYLYRFSYVQSSLREKLRAGAPHGSEISYVFGTLAARPGSTVSPEDLKVSRMAQSYWVNFASKFS